jgi:hypothetical protein
MHAVGVERELMYDSNCHNGRATQLTMSRWAVCMQSVYMRRRPPLLALLAGD